MPITTSAKKALRQNKQRRIRNRIRKRNLKSLTKKARRALSAGKFDEAKALLPQIYKALDKAAKRGVIKKNTASRKKSRLMKVVGTATKSS